MMQPDLSQKPKTMDSQARIELYVPERAVARHEATFQRWVELVTAPLRYVCVVDGEKTRFCDVPLGTHIKDFGDDGAPRRKAMSAFSGFSMARDQYGIWFRDETGAPEEDRSTVYSFLVAGELGEVAYYAIRERLAKKILRERNEEAVLLTRVLDSHRGLQSELVFESTKESAYREFAEAFESAAKLIAHSCPERIDLAWKLLHLYQLLQRDLMAAANKGNLPSEEILRPVFQALSRLVEGVFEGRIVDRMSSSILVSWVRIATKLSRIGDRQVASAVIPHVEQAISRSILEISDSLWRFQGHSFAGARDLACDSCGVEAFAFVATLNTSLEELGRGDLVDNRHAEELQRLWNDPLYIPNLLLRDFRGLSYALAARDRKDLATAFGLRTVDAITGSGISDEQAWYHGIMKDVFPSK